MSGGCVSLFSSVSVEVREKPGGCNQHSGFMQLFNVV